MKIYIGSANELYHYGIPGMKWGRRKAKQLEYEKAYNSALQDRTDLKARRLEDKQKAKLDKSYKKSAEYIKTKKEVGKKIAQNAIYGLTGSMRIDAFVKQGKTEKQAKARVIVEQLLTNVGVAGLVIGARALKNVVYK